MAWRTPSVTGFTHDALQALMRHELGAVRLPAFATPDECAALAEAAERHGFENYKDTVPPIGRIGVARFDYLPHEKARYRADAAAARTVLSRIIESSFDPFQRFAAALQASTPSPVRLAREEATGDYFLGVFRNMQGGAPPHIDYAPWEARGWAIADVTAQLTWNLYLTIPDEGGGTRIYDRAWQPEDERHKLPGSYAYASEVVDRAPACDLQPRLGEVIVFNTRNYHEVFASTSMRMTCGSFFGPASDGELWLWG